jgi:2-polyprenyl-3-methyl-5-hydroxy-6-metoxy-1,4-benzoquinol methylase
MHCYINPKHTVKSFSSFLFYCPVCDIVFSTSYIKQDIYKNHNYFTSNKIKRYGLDYEEIEKKNEKIFYQRIKRIISLHKKSGIKREKIKLLDVGAAFGGFVKLCKENGIFASGIELSPYAVNYAIRKNGIKLILGDYETHNFIDKFDVITMWYVLEHFKEPFLIIKKSYNLLNKNGILAISIPSLNGPLFRFRRTTWLKTRPIEHIFDFSPYSIKMILKSFGFKKIKIKIVSYHPERISSFISYRPFIWLYKAIAKIFYFSDTMEVYAIK